MKNVMNFNIRTLKDIRDIELPIMKIAVANVGSDSNMEYLKHLKKMFGQEIKVVTSGRYGSISSRPGAAKELLSRQC